MHPTNLVKELKQILSNQNYYLLNSQTHPFYKLPHIPITLIKLSINKYMDALLYSAGGAITGALSTGAAALGLSAAGFTSAGVVAGSAAAAAQAGMGGTVAAGSLFALLQSVAATGAIVTALPAVVGVGAVAGLGVYAATNFL